MDPRSRVFRSCSSSHPYLGIIKNLETDPHNHVFGSCSSCHSRCCRGFSYGCIRGPLISGQAEFGRRGGVGDGAGAERLHISQRRAAHKARPAIGELLCQRDGLQLTIRQRHLRRKQRPPISSTRPATPPLASGLLAGQGGDGCGTSLWTRNCGLQV